MKIRRKIKKLIFISLLPFGIFLTYISSLSPSYVEKLYSDGIYQIIGKLLSNLTGIFPFSIAEFLVLLIIFLSIYKILKLFCKILKQKEGRFSSFINSLVSLIATISFLYFLFIMIWGLNYYRLPFSQIADLDVQPATTKELRDLCEDIIRRANKLRNVVNEDSSGVMYIKERNQATFKRGFLGFEKGAELYPQLGGTYGQPKGVKFSKLMSYGGISGIYFPFTGEANVNTDIPDSLIPCTASHEMAHQRGFAREDEANYIAYLTCKLHPDVDFQYSGTLLALINSMNALYQYDKEEYRLLSQLYSNGVVRDLTAISKYWQKYEGPIERTSSKINNAYLKSNRQKNGIYSYGRMVDLLIAEYRERVSID